MTDAKRTGRVIGVMLLLQFVGLMVGFLLIDVLRSADFLSTAAGDSMRIKAGVLVLLANCALTIGIAVTGWRVFRDHGQSMGVWLILLSVIMFVLQAVDAAHIMSMLSLSQR